MQLALIRTYFGFTSLVDPTTAAYKSFKLFQKVKIKKVRKREEVFYDTISVTEIPYHKEPIRLYETGNPEGDLVLLIHGWESNAGSMSQIGNELAQIGKRVVSFDLPGHAYYESASTNLLECKEAMMTVLNHLNPQKPFSTISHSFGSAVTAFCLAEADYEVDKMIFLTGPNKVENVFNEFKEVIGLGGKAYKKLLEITHDKLGQPIENISIQRNLKKINYRKLLMIHDRYDKVLPFSNSAEINDTIENSQLIGMEKIGHYRMLWNEEVIKRCLGFIKGKEVL
ncbi:MAG: alpha/beta hydrolase [Flavobacteriales bacterium]|nr:alpha/beta hydrolase [Flavobacteriales bacterium]